MVCLPEYKAGRAETCQVTKVNDAGAGTVHYVRLPDGYLLDCGCGGNSQERAEVVRDAINVLMKWAYHWPPSGVIESHVRYSFADEDRWRREEADRADGQHAPSKEG
jgi:hypothetical protein